MFDIFERTGKELAEAEEYSVVGVGWRSQRVASTDPGSNFWQKFFMIVDHLLVSLEKRAKAYEDLASVFGFLPEISSMSSNDLVAAAQRVVAKYPDDFEMQLGEELVQFSSYMQNIRDLDKTGNAEMVDGFWEIDVYK